MRLTPMQCVFLIAAGNVAAFMQCYAFGGTLIVLGTLVAGWELSLAWFNKKPR